MGASRGESTGDIVARPTPQGAVALSQRVLLHRLSRRALERSYCKGLTDTGLLVLWREPRRVLLLALCLIPVGGPLMAVRRGCRGRRCRLVAILGGAMPFQTVFELLVVYRWLVKGL